MFGSSDILIKNLVLVRLMILITNPTIFNCFLTLSYPKQSNLGKNSKRHWPGVLEMLYSKIKMRSS